MKRYAILTVKFLWLVTLFLLKLTWGIIVFFFRLLDNLSGSTMPTDPSREKEMRDYKLRIGKYSNDKRWYDN